MHVHPIISYDILFFTNGNQFFGYHKSYLILLLSVYRWPGKLGWSSAHQQCIASDILSSALSHGLRLMEENDVPV